jgi:hypothetical protein
MIFISLSFHLYIKQYIDNILSILIVYIEYDKRR